MSNVENQSQQQGNNSSTNGADVSMIEWDDIESIKRRRQTAAIAGKTNSKKSNALIAAVTSVGVAAATTTTNDADHQLTSNASAAPSNGVPVSGRVWKDRSDIKRASAKFFRSPSLKPDWEEKVGQKKKMDAVKMKDREFKQKKKDEREVGMKEIGVESRVMQNHDEI
jgi:hypothetical protein